MSSTIRPACAGFRVALSVRSFTSTGLFIARCCIVAALTSLSLRVAFAQDDDDRLTILITASRFAETVDQALAPVTVITRAQIEETQASSVEEVLRTVPGIAFTNQGGTGKLSAVHLRGTESNHVLVLIDGVKVGSATAGTTRFEHLPLDQVEKIEVVRGPRSSLYGSESIGGVIQIFTRKGDGAPRPRFSAAIGSHNAGKMELGVSGREGDAWYSVGLSGEKTDGFDSCTGPGGCFTTTETDDDGHENRAVALRGGVALNDAVSIEGNLLDSQSETEFDGNFQNESETINRVASVKLNFHGDEDMRSSLQISRAQDQSDNFKDGVFSSTFNTERNQFAWQSNARVNENHRLIVGADHINDKINGANGGDDYAVRSRDNLGVFASWRAAFAVDDFEFSLREDDNEQFGDHTTGGIGWGRDLGRGNRVTASYGTAFTAPTFDDLYNPFAPNPDLKPEASKSFDFGLAHRGANGSWSFNLYRTKIDDLIVLDPARNYAAFNISEAEITGIELAGAMQMGRWNARANLTVQDAKDETTGARLIRRPQHIIHLDASRNFGAHSIGIALHHQGDSPDAPGSGIIDGHTVIDLRGEYRMHRHWSLGVKINNALDRDYETVRYYPQDGRNATVTLRYLP